MDGRIHAVEGQHLVVVEEQREICVLVEEPDDADIAVPFEEGDIACCADERTGEGRAFPRERPFFPVGGCTRLDLLAIWCSGT